MLMELISVRKLVQVNQMMVKLINFRKKLGYYVDYYTKICE